MINEVINLSSAGGGAPKVRRWKTLLMHSDNFHYNKKLQPLAAQLRQNLTKAEACLWKYALKAKQLKGYAFRRQRPVLQYIADFFCKELMLIIELDGITHDNELSVAKDIQREEGLIQAGFRIVRFTDEEVLNNMTGIISKLEKIISDIEISTPLIPRRRGTKQISSAGGGVPKVRRWRSRPKHF